MTADDNDRDAHARATKPSRSNSSFASSSASSGRASIDTRHHRSRRRRVGRAVDGCGECGIVEHRFAAGHPGSVAYPERMPRLRVAAAQLNVVVGDLEGNAARILDAYERAEAAGCDLVAFPELAVTAYPPEDLLLRPSFVARAGEVLEKLAARTGRTAAVVGLPRDRCATSTTPPRSARTGTCSACTASTCCPNYAVFDEQRYFAPSTVDGPLFVVGGRAGAVSRSAKTRGARTARSSPRRRAARSSSSTSTRRRTTRGGSGNARRCSRRAPPTRRCPCST